MGRRTLRFTHPNTGLFPSNDITKQLLRSIHSRDPIAGLTHGFYRYPASFHPGFSRAMIRMLSRPGDTVLDPFMGGGTTIVEALSLGRKAIGVDINPLAVFISRVKSTPLSPLQIAATRETIDGLRLRDNQIRFNPRGKCVDERFRNTPWWVRDALLTIQDQICRTRDYGVLAILRCGLLRTAKWALDCKKRIPGSRELLSVFSATVLEMCDQMDEYRKVLSPRQPTPIRHIKECRVLLTRSAIGLEKDLRVPQKWLPVRLVVTSPPYPGVHVLYHRWQVRGRRETPAPFAIVGSRDGNGPSYYTLAHRSQTEVYFKKLTAAYKSIGNLLAPDSLVVQLVSFADPKRQVKRFLDAMADAGFEECRLRDLGLDRRRRIWRFVPGRRWYSWCKAEPFTARELLLFHRLKRLC